MFKTTGTIEFGDTGIKGLRVPRMAVFGNKNNATPSPVDFTAEVLDPRVTFTCPSSHAYRTEDGTIQYAAANVYPLEYVNGVPAGRHEPEKASANIITNLTYQQMTDNGVVDGYTQVRETAENNYHRVSMNDTTSNTVLSTQVIYKQVNRLNQYLRFASSDASTFSNVAINNGELGYISPLVATANVGFISSESIILQVSFYDRGNVVGLLTSEREVTGDSIYTFAGSTDSGFDVFSMQIENSTFSTSPIAIGASRSESALSVSTEGASIMTIRYTDGTSATFNVEDSTQLDIPQSSANWGKRYITRIEYTL